MRARSQNCASSERIGDSRPNDRPEALGRLHDGVLIPGFVVGQHCHRFPASHMRCVASLATARPAGRAAAQCR
eukprot:3609518-Pyramimonas_sp.AAC.1